MKGFYSLISVGLCTTLMLASCEEDKVVNVNVGVEEAEQSDYTITADIIQPEIVGAVSGETRALCWKAGDAFTLWNRNTGKAYDFTISSDYDGSVPSNVAEFTGKAALQNNPRLLAVTPRRDAKVLNDLVTLSIPDTCQTDEGSKYAYMAASAVMSEEQVPSLTFSPMTAELNFNLKSIAEKDLQIAYVTLEAGSDAFPGTMTLKEDGTVGTLSSIRKSVTLDMGQQVLSVGGSLSGSLNLLPTTTGEENLLKSTTSLTLKVTLVENEQFVDMTVWEGTVKDLPLENGGSMEETAYQFCSGNEYLLSLNVNDFEIPEEGYAVDEEGTVHIYNADGLTTWANRASEFGDALVTVESRFIDGNTLNIDSWTTIPEFTGTFDGNGVVIKGLVINSVDNDYGFIGVNKGTVKNVCLSDASITIDASDANAGILVGQNDGLIQGCTVIGSSQASMIGAGSGNLGILVGVNAGKVLASFVGNETVVSYAGNDSKANIGGLIGWNNGGSIVGCYSLASIILEKAANAGGLVGSINKGVIGLSFADGKIVAQCNGWSVGGLIGNGEGDQMSVIRGCYSLTELPEVASDDSSSLGGLSGRGSNTSLSFKACYYLYGENVINGIPEIDGAVKLSSREELNDYVEAMNNATTGSGYKIVKDEEGTLIISPVEGGSEGPAFGDGGEI